MSELVCISSKDTNNAVLAKNTNKQKTIKKKINRTLDDKSKLWDIYDNDKSNIDNTNKEKIECIYAKDAEICNICKSPLMIMEDGFPTCTGKQCGSFIKIHWIIHPNGGFITLKIKIVMIQLDVVRRLIHY